MVRTPSLDENGRKKGAWSPEEDDKLRAYILKYGIWNWRVLPKYAGLSRCGKSCRLRWLNYLRPEVKRGNYSKEEQNMIMELHEKHGNKWSTIAASLPGRTDNEIKNYWHTQLKKHRKENQTKSKEQCEAKQESTELAPKNDDVAKSPTHHHHPVLESSPLSPEPCCSELSSLTSSDYDLLGDLNWVVEDSISSSESFAEPIGNFWTEPFSEDSSYNRNEFSSATLWVEGEFMFPYHSYYDGGSDFFLPTT